MRITRIAAILGVAATLVAVSACGSKSDTKASGSNMPAAAATTATPSPTADTAAQPFGTACSAVPTDNANPGSFAAMAQVPVATAASGNPLLKTLVTAVTKAGLGDSLNSAPAVTVFAPTNDAFAKIPADTLNAVLADNTKLNDILKYHVVGGRLTPAQLAGTHKTLQGEDLTVTGSGSAYMVNGASTVLCGNVQTANATVYIIDTVLMPKS